MSSDLRREALELARAARAHVEWLAESGVEELARDGLRHVVEEAPPPVRPMALIAPRAEDSEEGRPLPGFLVEDEARPTGAAVAQSSAAAPAASPRVILTAAERRDGLLRLADDVARCVACPLHATRTQTAFARGNPDAELVFVGEGPGTQEDLQGEPFVGPAGQLLDKMIAAMGFERDEVYVMNVVKCRPFEPANPNKDRKPSVEELDACRPHFDRQLDFLQPKAMVALGATAVQALTGTTAGITRLRGTWRLYRGRIPLMPTFHPAYLLRSPEKKREVWDDLQQVMQRLGRVPPSKSR